MTMRPMLAEALTPELLAELRFPYWVSPKLDGYRCVLGPGGALSKNLKPIRNLYVQNVLGKTFETDDPNVRVALPALDGELIVGSPTDPLCFNKTSSGVTSKDGAPEFTFHVFDWVDPENRVYDYRMLRARAFVREYGKRCRLQWVPHIQVRSVEELLRVEQSYLEEGYEGVMLRAPGGPYKFGRSTLKEGYLLKLKRFRDFEVRVMMVEEGEINGNEAKVNALGLTERSTKKAGKSASGMVGTLICCDLKEGKTQYRVGPGKLTHDQRKFFLTHQTYIIGRTIKVRVFDYGAKDTPRFPMFHGFVGGDDASLD